MPTSSDLSPFLLYTSATVPEPGADHHQQPGSHHQAGLDQSGASGVPEGKLKVLEGIELLKLTSTFRT